MCSIDEVKKTYIIVVKHNVIEIYMMLDYYLSYF